MISPDSAAPGDVVSVALSPEPQPALISSVVAFFEAPVDGSWTKIITLLALLPGMPDHTGYEKFSGESSPIIPAVAMSGAARFRIPPVKPGRYRISRSYGPLPQLRVRRGTKGFAAVGEVRVTS